MMEKSAKRSSMDISGQKDLHFDIEFIFVNNHLLSYLKELAVSGPGNLLTLIFLVCFLRKMKNGSIKKNNKLKFINNISDSL
jgi:hypothetical protein